MLKVDKNENQGQDNRQGREKGKNPGLDRKTRVGVPTPVLIPGVLFGRQEY